MRNERFLTQYQCVFLLDAPLTSRDVLRQGTGDFDAVVKATSPCR
jgi:hypothetical protein